ncbi:MULTISPECIES: ketopantoate reductase family protein [unclassified Oceanobacter]|uniref:ketopantoate reductase family protein n=1 Tax=unclassified Oceanobacter TaxID=2620260 RepID=UPI0026E3E2AC|nr:MULTISPECIES: 2-dehydropantoate 2-reductase [unclassified Oceanobacter]MDO6683273.1 2-dehydropantoate 2-reductase [Oceanobacter sp. 5_MG-2023]MDP2504161.1 2-dehydropantoate 2-reductase [Oceanobacter sp. 3_MG-2023]MDP2610206.1 2-dehydropantoate 2-reductase [Oceanobacter sp. 1_MG-2023]MDP2613472.1 2-dehydropantoate 2-reductase [Oceanobacter sp. 2_MG-2023]
MRICIAGAGAIGCTLAARIAASGQPVNVLARGATLQQLQHHGIRLNDLDGEHTVSVHASESAEALGPQDLILVCTKAPALGAVFAQIQPMLHPDTVVIPVVNGLPWWYFRGIESRFANDPIKAIDPDGELNRLVPQQHLIGCVVFITATRTAPGIVNAANPHLMIIGEITHQLTDRLERIRQLIEHAGIEARSTDNIRDQIWTKVIANLTSNPLSVISGATLEQLYSDPQLQPLVRRVLDETLLAAASHGARVRFDPQSIMEMGTGMGAIKTSMLQDFEAGAPLELATIGHAVVEVAEKTGIDMPTTRHILALAEFLSQQQRNA